MTGFCSSGPSRLRGEMWGKTLGCGSKLLFPRSDDCEPPSPPKILEREKELPDFPSCFITIGERLVCIPSEADGEKEKAAGATDAVARTAATTDENLMVYKFADCSRPPTVGSSCRR